MTTVLSNDPRALRTREALLNAFMELLRTRSFQKITITDITTRAGIARHTFYNHYQTKVELLNTLVDLILDQFFSGIDNWNFYLADPQEELQMFTSFFQAWMDHADIVRLLNSVDMDNVLVERLKTFFTRFYHERVTREMPGVNLKLAEYIVSFNAYSLLGILKPWFADKMRYPPEVMAGFTIRLTGSSQRMKAVEEYLNIFK